jgi:hypothetical protein
MARVMTDGKRGKQSYNVSFEYKRERAMRFREVFELAMVSGSLSVPRASITQRGTINTALAQLRVYLAWLKDHGMPEYRVNLSLRAYGDSVLIIRKRSILGYTFTPKPLLVHDASGNPMWLHGPPPTGGTPETK